VLYDYDYDRLFIFNYSYSYLITVIVPDGKSIEMVSIYKYSEITDRRIQTLYKIYMYVLCS